MKSAAPSSRRQLVIRRQGRSRAKPILPPDIHHWIRYVSQSGTTNAEGDDIYLCRWQKPGDPPCKYAGTRNLVRRHVNCVHLERRCVCGVELLSIAILLSHELIRPHVCPECKQKFSQKSAMTVHLQALQYDGISPRTFLFYCILISFDLQQLQENISVPILQRIFP